MVSKTMYFIFCFVVYLVQTVVFKYYFLYWLWVKWKYVPSLAQLTSSSSFFIATNFPLFRVFKWFWNLQEIWGKRKKWLKMLECQENYPERCHNHFIFNCFWLHCFGGRLVFKKLTSSFIFRKKLRLSSMF